ncbi:TldD/PmbA family protein [Anaeroselena agilis]|uniref:TldD/PmbA family protein n=1 Tax=Anaeroselena agilis TaxID=3063788 RepID=A0ABU3NXT3_9FIRM|nr:TldD/PmbA family protein [Selenomonadales bacterium 4137-cl]
MDNLEQARQAVREAIRQGAHAAEAYLLDSQSLLVEVADQAVETLKFANDTGLGVRVFARDGRVGFAFATDISTASLAETARQAIANSRITFPDTYNTLPASAGNIPSLRLLDPAIGAAAVERKIELAKGVEAAARRRDGRVKRTERCVYEDAEYGVALANSNELAVSYRSGYCGLYGVVLAEDGGDVQTGMGLSYSRDFAALDPEEVGREAAREACLLLGAKEIGTVKAAIVLPPYVATNFLAVLVPALSADAVQKGRSLFRDSVGKKVASPFITLVDDGRLDGGVATSPVDGEGVLTGRTELITSGVLQGFLHNTYTAGRVGAASTGNGVRHSFRGMPEVGPTNIFFAKGETPRDELIGGVKEGLYITSVMGMHTANPISGDFSVGAAGVWIRDGQFTQPVRGVAIAGNILDFLGEVDAVGDDLRFFGSQGAPTLRIDKITISGA